MIILRVMFSKRGPILQLLLLLFLLLLLYYGLLGLNAFVENH